MNIAFFNSSKTWGGGEKWHFDIALKLHQKKHAVTLFSYFKGDLYEKSIKSSLPSISVKIGNLSFFNIFKIVKIAYQLKKNKTDFLIANLPSDLKITGIAGRLARVKKIIYRRGSAIPIKNSFSNKIIFKYLVDGIITNSYQTKATILHHNAKLFPSQKIKVIYNGIDLKNTDSTNLNEESNKQGPIVIGNLGRMVKQKNQIQLIEIAHSLKKEKIDFGMIIGGDGKLRERLEEEIKSNKLEETIKLVGFIHNVRQFMESIDIFVLPSLWEGFGYVLVEAQAYKKPVVAYNLSSNPEVIDNKKTGFLIDQYKPEEMVSRLKQLVTNEKLRKQMGINARKFVEQKFDIETTLSEVENFLRLN